MGNNSSYEAILADYSAHIAAAAPGLVAEYNAEYSVYPTISSEAGLCNEKISKLAAIETEGSGKMADYYLAAGDSYNTYESRSKKLYDVYQSNAQKITDAYMASCRNLW